MEVLKNFKDLFLDVWSQGISGVNITEIFIALGIFFFFLFLRGMFAKFIVKRLEAYVSKSTNKFDNSLVSAMESPAKFFPIVIGFFIATNYITVEGKGLIFLDQLNRSLITILIFLTFHQAIGPLSVLIKSVSDLLSKDLIDWIIKAIKVLIIILGAAAVLELWGIKIGPIIAGLGLFQVGDWIFVEGVIEGTVESIGFRSTVVRRFDKSLATIPNFQFAEKAVINNSQTTNRRICWIIGLEYRTSSEQLTKIKEEIIKFIEGSDDFAKAKDTLLSVKIDQFAASSIDIRLICYTKTAHYKEWLNVKDKLAIEIKNIVEKNKASFAFPSTSVYVEKNT